MVVVGERDGEAPSPALNRKFPSATSLGRVKKLDARADRSHQKAGFHIRTVCVVCVYGNPRTLPWPVGGQSQSQAELGRGDGRVIEASPESYMKEPLTERERESITVVE